jgi:acyl phosphate:glycerol-3-phosphate acyltransferase
MSLLDIALVTAGYLLGAVPFGLLVARAVGFDDLTQRGSGNIGATNVARVVGRRAGAVTLAADVLKGAVPVWAAVALSTTPSAPVWVATATVIGHVFPVYLGFRGGKGVATGFGVLMALQFMTALLTVGVWLAAWRLSRTSAIGALAAYAALPAIAWWFRDARPGLFPFACGLAVVVLLRHTDNVRRMLAARKGGAG